MDRTFITRHRTTLPYAIALLLLPLLVLWHHDDPLYTPLWQADPWFYLGYFYNLVNFKRDLFPGFYYGSRLSWVLPGVVAHWMFSPLIANALMHLGVHSVGVLAMFSTLRRTAGLRAAYLGAMMFSFYPWFWAATGWDHVNGAALAYYLVAMALLTREALLPERKWNLILSGMALSGAVQAHLFVVALTPFLLLQYLGFSWVRKGRLPALSSLPRVAGWLAAGFTMATLPVCAINYLFVDGNPWFWSPSFRTAQSVTQNYLWIEGLTFEGRLDPYLWFIIAACGVALALLPLRWKFALKPQNAAGLIYSAQLLGATALLVFLQARGVTLLGHYYYACYLFPFVFLVLGSSLWPAVEGMRPQTWLITAGVGTILFALPWVEPEANPALGRWMTEAGAFSIAGGLLALALVLRARFAGAWLALGGLALLTALTYNGSHRYVPIHGTKAEYARIMDARRLIEEHRDNALIQFWYDKSEPDFFEYQGLNASYISEFSRISENFPQGCQAGTAPGTMIVVSSAKENARDLALQALADCWRGSGVKPALQALQRVERQRNPFQIVLVKAVNDFSHQRPLRVDFAPSGTGRLQLVENPTELPPLPLERWMADAGTTMQNGPAGLAVTTPQGRAAYTMTYAPLVAPAAGKYRFEMRYKPGQGRIAFGAFPADQSRWLASDLFGHTTKAGSEMAFTLELNAGDTVLLRIANNNPADTASSFVIQDIFVTVASPSR